MIVMPSNNSGIQVGYLCGKYPGRIGWLIGPGGWLVPPSWMPYAIDNGAYGAWANNRPWDEGEFIKLLERVRVNSLRCHFPLWVVVPDVVADREGTLRMWEKWSPIVAHMLQGTELAMAVQDGMTPEDVPENATVVFVGGTTEWKWRYLRMWTDSFPRVHVARVNSERTLWMAHEAGAVSVDGTGWVRGGEERLAELEHYLHESTHGRKQMILESIL